MIAALMIHDQRSISLVASNRTHGYRSPHAVVNPMAGFGDPMNSRRNSAPITIAGAFFVPARPVYGGCAWETLGSAGFLDSRFANPRTAATLIRLATKRGSSSNQGAPSMQFSISTITPAIRALAHRRMALSALRANSSLSIRLKRYNQHMGTARHLESMLTGGAQ